MGTTVKVSARIPRGPAERMDSLIEQGIYPNRSEIIKEALREFLLRKRPRTAENSEIKPYLKAVEGILRRDWESAADEYWDDVGESPMIPPGELPQWKIVLLGFPFVDLTNRKLRPVLIVSNDEINRTSNAVVALQITSNLGSGFRSTTSGYPIKTLYVTPGQSR